MKILSSSVKLNFTIKKSKFICLGYFVQTKEEIKNLINEVKKEHPDASHICYAYILDDKAYYYSDGGEPSGTAGKPIYGAIQSLKFNYTLLIVIRYFGGIKFGTGPLRATFKDVSVKTLESAKFKNAELLDVIQIKVLYPELKHITSIFKKNILHQTFNKENVMIDLVGQKTIILNHLKQLNIKPISIKENQVV